MMNQRETATHAAALADLDRAETARDAYAAQVEGLVRRLRESIDAGLITEETSEYIRTGAGEPTAPRPHRRSRSERQFADDMSAYMLS